ncbi:hypothetical protein ruthe_01138 [Rubellimicrobium thermophilum DSM 16684]|uniref:Uncharacterized protein n=1 Tax=Rubellimicrobium thermophilum DSM 16684 TaxID=1123069 RepID=S9SIY0_9RHOB|nr:hypothetical protein [Rubellimicrobium thermophilum]EPX86324.1 hypothetical protein ruthe_01138 [Rubellimicrobium thermophilum DSM 16684]
MRPALATLVLLIPAAASADAEAAWQDHRLAVEIACREEAARAGWNSDRLTIEVNPFGSETHGVALLTIAGEGGAGEGGSDRLVCLVEKATGRTELTAPFAPLPE